MKSPVLVCKHERQQRLMCPTLLLCSLICTNKHTYINVLTHFHAREHKRTHLHTRICAQAQAQTHQELLEILMADSLASPGLVLFWLQVSACKHTHILCLLLAAIQLCPCCRSVLARIFTTCLSWYKRVSLWNVQAT